MSKNKTVEKTGFSCGARKEKNAPRLTAMQIKRNKAKKKRNGGLSTHKKWGKRRARTPAITEKVFKKRGGALQKKHS